MRTASAKAKGRSLQRWTADRICLLLFGRPCSGYDDEVAPREMGQKGTDVRIVSKRARIGWPFGVECKNGNSWSINAAIKQAKANAPKGINYGGTMPDNVRWMFIGKRDRDRPVACLDAALLFAILGRLPRSGDTEMIDWDLISWDMEHAEK